MPDGKDNGKEVKPTPPPWGKFSNSFGDLQQELKRRSKQTKHTPGPWKAIGNIVRIRSMVIHQCTPDKGFPISKSSNTTHMLYEESEANARLIAAAPELLEALEDVSQAYQQMFDVMPVAWQTIDDLVTAAIAKAKGET